MKTAPFLRRAILCTALAGFITACGGGGGGGSGTPASTPSVQACQSPTSGADNVISVCVDDGPLSSQREVNRLYVDITICAPGTSSCQTIDHVLVDTASVGLRLLDSVVTVGSGKTSYFNCARFLDLTYTWGAVKTLDLRLGQQKISALPVQVFGSSFAECASGGYSAIESIADLGAKGILGIGLFEQDCGADCSIASTGQYYRCQAGVCTGSLVEVSAQLQNPIARLGDGQNNGFVVKLPAVSAPGISTLRGELVFGVDTQANNKLGSASVLNTNAWGEITTNLAGRTYAESFIDTGSNGLYFDIAQTNCVGGGDFYCPSTQTPYSAMLTGEGGAPTVAVGFDMGNAESLFELGHAVLPTLAGPVNDAAVFDWGLPFYFGRSVFQGISGKSTPGNTHTGPFIAF